jgi:hypothetical protein
VSKDPTPSATARRSETDRHPGISNRESAAQERAERAEHPPIDSGAGPSEDAAEGVGEDAAPPHDVQTSHKAGSRSRAQKTSGSRYADKPAPASKKVPGASGKEPDGK